MNINEIVEQLQEIAEQNNIDLWTIFSDIHDILEESLMKTHQDGYAEGFRAGTFQSGGYMSQEDLDAYREDSIRAFKKGFSKSLENKKNG